MEIDSVSVKRTLEIALEIAVGVSVVAGVYFWATHMPGREPPVKWIALGLNTAVLFGYPLYWFRATRKGARFWACWAGFLLLHLGVFIPVLRQSVRWPLVLFVVTTVVEFLLIDTVLLKALDKPPAKSARHA